MANDTMYQPKVRETVPAGEYLFIVRNVEVVENNLAKEGQDTKQIRLTLGLEKEPGVPVRDEDGTAHTQWAWMSRTLGHKKDGTPYKSHAWSEAILGQRLNSREPFDFGDLLDKRGKVYIDRLHLEDGSFNNKIVSISPLSGEIKGPAYNENKSQAVADERDLLTSHAMAKVKLIDAGIKLEAIEAITASIAGSKEHFANLPKGSQIDVVKWLQQWAASPADYDEAGALKGDF